MKKALVAIVGTIVGVLALPAGSAAADDDPITCLHLHVTRQSACVYQIPRPSL